MAMIFSRAQRAENPDMAEALALQQQQANQLKQGEAQQKAGFLNAGVGLAGAAPEDTFSNAWDMAMAEPTTIGDFSMVGDGASALSGDVIAAEMGADTAAGFGADALGAEALGAGFEGGAAALGGEAALGAEALAAGMAPAAVEAGALTAAGGAGASAGGGAALASMGPVGWAALAALAMGLM